MFVIKVQIEQLPSGESHLAVVLATLARIETKVTHIVSEVDDLNASMATITTAVGDAVTKITELSAQIQANSGDPVAIEDAVGKLNTLAANLEAAVNPPAP